MMRLWRWAAVLLTLAGVAAAGCATARGGADSPPGPVQHSALSLIYGRMLQAISRPGEVYHPTITAVTFQDPYTVTTTSELWIDTARGRARVAVRTAFGEYGEKASTWIIDGDRWYERLEDGTVRKREAVTCRESDSTLLSLLLGCRDFTETGITAPVGTPDRFEGTQVAAILTQGTIHGRSEDTVFTDTLYVDLATFLPLALERSGALRRKAIATELSGDPAETAVGQITRYKQGFVPEESLAPDFFDPASIGYIETDPAIPLLKPSPDLAYYWLGRTAQGDGLPELALEGAFVAEAAARPLLRYRAILKYRAAEDEFGETLVELQEWRADEWDGVAAGGTDPAGVGPCATTSDVELGGAGQATIYAVRRAGADEGSGSCAETPADQFVAVVRIGSSVIRLSAPGESGWNSDAGMRAAVGALTVVGGE